MSAGKLQCWGGIECTVNRVGDRWFDQLERTGHARRIDDLELIAGLGIRTLRYPILWERSAPDDPGEIHWGWNDERLERLRSLGIEPIVGLVHHGSGPGYTNLLDAHFATGLARYAREVAQRYPWLRMFTPVNEPLTTARFSALYGHWYPHRRDDRSFVRALLNQCRGTVLAMQAIREFIPDAQLVQTDDLGTTYATPRLQQQADFDNERRWLGWDLLCGRVDAAHPLRGFLLDAGASSAELDAFVAARCVPDVIGINHYVTSDRFLDEAVGRYPAHTHGGNHRQPYADVEAVRVLPEYRPWQILHAAWKRYERPLAITEAHLGCTREEQVRWLHEGWQAALEARAEGCDIRAVTAWSLFGSYNWNSLLTQDSDHYEPGAFDVRGARPRATALAGFIRALCAGSANAPAWGHGGWWSRSERLHYKRGDLGRVDYRIRARARVEPTRAPPLLIAGAGTLGRAMAEACSMRGIAHRLLSRREMDASQPQSVAAVLDAIQPWAVVNATGFVRVDDAERDPQACFRDNFCGPRMLAEATASRDISLLTFSSDLVFDGTAARPYVESSPVHPLNVYGRSKAASESSTITLNPRTLCIRTAAFFGYWHISDFLWRAVCTLSEGKTFEAMSDVTVSPTYVPDLVQASLDLLLDEASGLWHLSNRGALTWADFAKAGAQLLGVDTRHLRRLRLSECKLPAERPHYAALASERGDVMPTLESALDRFAVIARSGRLGNLKLAQF